jgi:hypothetical protein
VAKLISSRAPIATGLYVMRHGTPHPNTVPLEKSPTVGNWHTWAEIFGAEGPEIRVSGGCMGCLLLTRPAIEDFNFVTGVPGPPDIPFMQYHWKKGTRQIARLDVLCGHIKPNGQILWPEASERGYRIEHTPREEMSQFQKDKTAGKFQTKSTGPFRLEKLVEAAIHGEVDTERAERVLSS